MNRSYEPPRPPLRLEDDLRDWMQHVVDYLHKCGDFDGPIVRALEAKLAADREARHALQSA